MKHKTLTPLATTALLASIAAADRVSAAFTYTFTAGSPTYNAAAATDVFPLYLHEASTTGSSQINSDGGLYSFGLTAAVTAGPGSIQSLVRNPAFDETENGTTTAFPAATAKLYADQNANYPNGPTADGAGNVPLATLTLSNVTAATTFTLADFGTGSQTVDYAGNALDPTTTTTTVASVPEPVVGLAVVGLALIRRRGVKRD